MRIISSSRLFYTNGCKHWDKPLKINLVGYIDQLKISYEPHFPNKTSFIHSFWFVFLFVKLMRELIPDRVTPTFKITRPKWIIFSYAQKRKKKSLMLKITWHITEVNRAFHFSHKSVSTKSSLQASKPVWASGPLWKSLLKKGHDITADISTCSAQELFQDCFHLWT